MAHSASTVPSRILLVGSPRSINDGTYQDLVTHWENHSPTFTIEKQLCDRISDGATALVPSSFDAVHLTVHAADLVPDSAPSIPLNTLSGFVQLIVASLKPLGTLTWTTGTPQSSIKTLLQDHSQLRGVEETVLPAGSRHRISAQKDLSSMTHSTNDAVQLNLPNKINRASLWSFSRDDADLIDESTLLTDEDLQRPSVLTSPDACNPKKAKKACKNCTCGLRELELVEEHDLPDSLQKSNGANGAPKAMDSSKVTVTANGTRPFTSSCGSCYLGDAFRCSSCPYLGMPAFEPGQEVKLTANMGDDI